MALTKSDIMDRVQEELGYPKLHSAQIVESLLEIIKADLTAGNDLLISGLGQFCVNEKSSRRGRNPATGSDLMLRKRRVVVFKCSGGLRRKIKQK